MPSTTIRKPLSPLKITLAVILIISVLFPLFFAYIDREADIKRIVLEFIFTTTRLGGIALICYGVIALMNVLFHSNNRRWWWHIIEIVFILFFSYWFLIAFVVFIDRPITNSPAPDPELWSFRRYIGLYFIGAVFIYTFLTGLNIYQLASKKAAQAEQLQRDYAQVRLLALRSQINPHFLFNSLSVLSSLVHVNAELSEKFIVQLSKAYRYILDQKDLELVPLREELDFLDAYFFLLQIRFEQKVQLNKQINIDVAAYKLPPLTLQLLVENAVKHNKMSMAEPLIINIKNINSSLIIENKISVREQHETSTGIGLENINKRYAMITDKKVVIEKTEQSFIVTIPLLKL